MLKDRLVVLNDTDQALAEIFKFNQELAEFDKTLSILQGWCDGKAKVRFIYLNTGLFLVKICTRCPKKCPLVSCSPFLLMDTFLGHPVILLPRSCKRRETDFFGWLEK